MERPGSADPNGEKVAERTWDCPCHAWHLGSLRRSIVSGEPKCRPSPSVPYANGAWRARDLPETALHATSPRLTPRPSTASLTCVTVWEREVVQGVVNPPRIDGMQALRLSYLRSSIIPSRVRCARCVPEASTGGHRPAAKLQVSRPTRQLGYDPSQGGSAGSNPVGATIQHQHNTAADLDERRSEAALCIRPGPVKSGCGRASVPYSCPRFVPVMGAGVRRKARLLASLWRGQGPGTRVPTAPADLNASVRVRSGLPLCGLAFPHPWGRALSRGRRRTGPLVGLWLMTERIVRRRPGRRFGVGSHAPIRAPRVGSA